MKKIWQLTLFFLLTTKATADIVSIDLTIPELNVDPYHKPYVAVWLESLNRKGLETIAVWYEKDDWLKDLRQWWRKIGRNKTSAYDAVTGATRKPGIYTIRWNSKNNPTIAAGDYWLCFEASREAGGRDFFRQKIQLGQSEAQTFQIDGDIELGQISISIQP